MIDPSTRDDLVRETLQDPDLKATGKLRRIEELYYDEQDEYEADDEGENYEDSDDD